MLGFDKPLDAISLIDKILIWRVIKDSDLLFHFWETEIIVYNSLSGETHQIDDLSASVLEKLINHPCSEENLLMNISKLYPLEENTRIQQLLAQVINNFDQIGLIEPQY